MLKPLITAPCNIKIIGDSLAAGAGSSMSYSSDEILIEDEGTLFYKRIAPLAWWGLLSSYFEEKQLAFTINNKGCCGAFSYQIEKHLQTLVSPEDHVVMLLMGLNDRKRQNGMSELRLNYAKIVDYMLAEHKTVIAMTPTPSAYANEYLPNRIHHTAEVVQIIREIAQEKNIMLIDVHRRVCDYVLDKGLSIEDVIYEENCLSDGLHPPDLIQHLIYEQVIESLSL